MKHFNYTEFDCKCGNCEMVGERMDAVLLDVLDNARNMASVPFHITSGLRCVYHNEKIGGSETSSHLEGLAVDIAVQDSSTREAILTCLIGELCGENIPIRIGIAPDFIHVDIDPSKDGDVIWLY